LLRATSGQSNQQSLRWLNKRNKNMTEEKVKNKRGGAGRGQGRKPISNLEKSVTINMRVTPTQKLIFKRRGGAKWFREMINAAGELTKQGKLK
jgi:hypothetical protein